MAKRWIGVALIAWCLAETTAARAQMGPDGGGCPPDMVPGPISPQQAPPGPPQSDCLSLPANIPNAFSEECVEPCPCVFMSGEFLYWTLKSPRLSTTLITSDPNPPPGNVPPAGLLGAPTTQEVVRENSLKYSPAAGARLSAGVWFDSHNIMSLEGTAFVMERRSTTQAFASDPTGRPLIFLPFFDNQGVGTGTGPGEFGFAAAIPDFRVGGAAVSSSTNLWGAESNLVNCFWQDCGIGASWLFGFRYVDLDEKVQITERSQAINGSTINFGVPFPDPNSISVIDRFRGRNQFYGGQLGLRAAATWRSLFFAAQGKLALGATHEVVDISGISTLNMPNATVNGVSAPIPPTTIAVGRFAAPSNIGTFISDRFAIVPEFEGRVGVCVSQGVIVFAGYNFLYINHVARPGDQIDRSLDLTQIPTAFEYNPNVPGTRPRVPMTQSYFWAQGLDFGIEIAY
jgi:hypothetical protein